MESSSFFVYAWHIDEKEKDVTSIRAYGLNSKNENVCIRIDDFTPYVYVELPDNIQWTETRAQLVSNKLDDILGQSKPIKMAPIFLLSKKTHVSRVHPLSFIFATLHTGCA